MPLSEFCVIQGLASLVLKPVEESDLSPMDTAVSAIVPLLPSHHWLLVRLPSLPLFEFIKMNVCADLRHVSLTFSCVISEHFLRQSQKILTFKTQILLGLSRHDTFGVSSPCISAVLSLSNCAAQHARRAFWLCRAWWTAWLDTLDTTSSTGFTRRTCHIVLIRHVTSQVEFGLKLAIVWGRNSTAIICL